MMKIIRFIILFFFFISKVNGETIVSIAQINNYSITNLDLQKEVYIREILEQKKINDKNYLNYILENLIEEKVKELETKKRKIVLDEKIINFQVNKILNNKKLSTEEIKTIKDHVYKKIKISMMWNELVKINFEKNLNININEINENIKSKKIDIKKREELIQIEKIKKINLLSKSLYNEIKREYLIKKL